MTAGHSILHTAERVALFESKLAPLLRDFNRATNDTDKRVIGKKIYQLVADNSEVMKQFTLAISPEKLHFMVADKFDSFKRDLQQQLDEDTIDISKNWEQIIQELLTDNRKTGLE